MRPEQSLLRIEVRRNNNRVLDVARPDQLCGTTLSSVVPSSAFDLLLWVLLAALLIVASCTFKDYAISNDEGVQQRYGELIVEYYRSGFVARDLFTFENLYLYGGLFDLVAIALAHVVPMDVYELRHILCAVIGIGGVAAAAMTARLIAGSRAGLAAAIALTLCGVWYGSMYNHTKDIPFAAAMAAATLFLVRVSRRLPSPRIVDVVAFGCFSGAALGIRSLGLLSIAYLGLAIIICLPWRAGLRARLRVAGGSVLMTVPAVLLAYLIMIVAWPWAALSPLNPIRGLFAFSEFHYAIRTMFAGQIYEMAGVPRLYVVGYLLIRVPLIVLAGAGLGMASLLQQSKERGEHRRGSEIALVSLTVIVPLMSQVALHGPAFTGMRHFLFVLPPLATLAGVGFNALFDKLAERSVLMTLAALALVCACVLRDGSTLVRLHPYENLSYNSLVGGLPGAFRRYDMDYWFNSMREATRMLEAFVRGRMPVEAGQAPKVYSVAVCGERLPFDRTVSLPQLHWDFGSEWDESEFFIAPTHMNCDRDLDGEVIAIVERLGVPIAYVKDRRAVVKSPAARAAPLASGQEFDFR
jgi:hypothetical protein